MTFAGFTLTVFSLGLLIVRFAVLMQFLAGLDRVQALWHQRTPLIRPASPDLPDLTSPTPGD